MMKTTRYLNKAFWLIAGVCGVGFMVTPLLLVVFFSFGKNPHATFPVGGFTLDWYRALFANREFWQALERSTIVTLSVGAISTLTGTLAALGLARMRPRAAGIMLTVMTLPVMLPPLVLALALATFYSSLGIKLGVHTVIPSHLVFTQPFVVLIIYAQMANFDYAVIDSARDLGASPRKVFFTVILPIIQPTLIGAALIAMAVSLDDFIITFFTLGGGMTLPTLIWGMLRRSLDPSINALGTLILAVTIGSSLVALKITKYRG